MSINGDILRGHTDMIILSILEKEDSYGYMVNRLIEEWTHNDFALTEATLYTSFKRLEKSDLVVSYWLESDSGKKRKYYSITKAGKDYLKEQIDQWQETKSIIDMIISREKS